MIDKLFPVPVGDSKIPIFLDSIVSYNFRMNLTYAKIKRLFATNFSDCPNLRLKRTHPCFCPVSSDLKIIPGYHKVRMEI